MVEVELLQRPPLKLEYALLVYEGDRHEVAVTKNMIVEGAIQPGEPLDVESFIEGFSEKVSASGGGRASKGDFVWSDQSLLAENSGWRIWWTPAQRRELFISGVPKRCWLPALIWAGHRRVRSCFLWSTTDKRRPTAKTICYRPRFGPVDGTNHIHADCSICLGTMNPGRFTPREWSTAFYDTNFKTADGLPLKPYALQKIHKKIGTLETCIAGLSTRIDPAD